MNVILVNMMFLHLFHLEGNKEVTTVADGQTHYHSQNIYIVFESVLGPL